MNITNKKSGFTIIEVVLVLAIAGLIFLMVFIALPALQSGQRDSARKSEVSTVASAITSYMSNNRNNIPTAPQIGSYVTGKSGNGAEVLESGTTIIRRTTAYNGNINLAADLNGTPDPGNNTLYAEQLKVYFGYKCSSDGDSLERGASKQAAIVVALESGPSGGSVYCLTN